MCGPHAGDLGGAHAAGSKTVAERREILVPGDAQLREQGRAQRPCCPGPRGLRISLTCRKMKTWATPVPTVLAWYLSLNRAFIHLLGEGGRDLLPILRVPSLPLTLFHLQGPLQALFLTHGMFFLSRSFSLISKPSCQAPLCQSRYRVAAPGSSQLPWTVRRVAGSTLPRKKRR